MTTEMTEIYYSQPMPEIQQTKDLARLITDPVNFDTVYGKFKFSRHIQECIEHCIVLNRMVNTNLDVPVDSPSIMSMEEFCEYKQTGRIPVRVNQQQVD